MALAIALPIVDRRREPDYVELSMEEYEAAAAAAAHRGVELLQHLIDEMEAETQVLYAQLAMAGTPAK